MKYKGLLYKDLMNLRSSFAVLVVLFVILGSIFFAQGSFFAIFFIIMMYASLLVLSSMSQDTEAKWDTFALTTAASRKDLVRSKYLLMVLLSIPFWIIGILLYILVNTLTDFQGLNVALILVTIATGLLHGSIMLPLKFKYDSSAIHYLSIVVIVLLAIVASVPYFFMLDAVGTALYPVAVGIVLGVFAVGIIGFCLSYLMSQKIFAKKEF